VDQGGLTGTDTADNGNQLSRVCTELGHVEGEVVLAMVLELSVALQVGRARRSRQAGSSRIWSVTGQ
jgi:hypothetical protein